ncbi:MAG: TolC family protein [Longimicrobiales bacterium]
MRRSVLLVAVATVLGAACPPPGAAQAAAPSTRLDDVLQEVAERNPRLRALAAGAEATLLQEPEASTLPDPVLQVGVMNVGLPDLNADMPASMAPSIQIMQAVPFPGTLGLRGRIAGLGSELATVSVDESWWQIRAAAAGAFYDLYVLDRRIAVMRETLTLLEDFRLIARALYGAGEGRQADVLRADVEVARIDAEVRSMEARRTATAARLNALRDRAADAPVPSPALGALPLDVPPVDTLRLWAERSRPMLERGRLTVEQAGVRRDLAARRVWPDLMVGVGYGQRNRGAGTERMGSLTVGATLPIHAGSRQHAFRAEAGARQRLAQAELDGLRADVEARLGEIVAELDRARSLTTLYREEVLPQARANVASALSSYRVGAVDFLTLIDAQMTVNRYQSELFQLLGEYGRAVAALESTLGRSLPVGTAVLTEAS